MKYLPIFRSRQYELIALRELADTIAGGPIVPAVEPSLLSTLC